MKKILSSLAVVLCFLLLAGCAALEDAAKLQEYDLQGDTLPSVNAIVGTREVTGVSSSTSNGDVTKEYTYKSASVSDDLTAFLTELVYERGYIAIDEDIDLETVPGTAKVAAVSPSDSGKIIIVDISYDQSGYTIKLTRMTGTLNTY